MHKSDFHLNAMIVCQMALSLLVWYLIRVETQTEKVKSKDNVQAPQTSHRHDSLDNIEIPVGQSRQIVIMGRQKDERRGYIDDFRIR